MTGRMGATPRRCHTHSTTYRPNGESSLSEADPAARSDLGGPGAELVFRDGRKPVLVEDAVVEVLAIFVDPTDVNGVHRWRGHSPGMVNRDF
jgi:hypothetical protein